MAIRQQSRFQGRAVVKNSWWCPTGGGTATLEPDNAKAQTTGGPTVGQESRQCLVQSLVSDLQKISTNAQNTFKNVSTSKKYYTPNKKDVDDNAEAQTRGGPLRSGRSLGNVWSLVSDLQQKSTKCSKYV